MEAFLNSFFGSRLPWRTVPAPTKGLFGTFSRQVGRTTRMQSTVEPGPAQNPGGQAASELPSKAPDLQVSQSTSPLQPAAENHQRKRILFVDDEKPVLLVLRAFMQRLSNEWETECGEGGSQALALMEQQPFDVIITDMRMPDMNGTELLNEVMKRYPRTVRIVLSGHADEQTVQESVGVAHQWVAKPFDLQALRSILNLISRFHRRLENPAIKEVIGRIRHLPSVPQLYFEIIEALQSSTSSTQTIANIIARDPALTAKSE